MTTIRVIPRCLCSHSDWRHVGMEHRCMASGCGCMRFRVKTVGSSQFDPGRQPTTEEH